MILHPGSPRGTRALGFLLLIATFVVGAISGAAFERTLGAREPQKDERCGSNSSNPLQRPVGSLLISHVELSADQRQKIDRILDRRRAETDSVWRAQKPRLRSIVDSTRSEIQALLTPAQRAEYDRLLAAKRAYHKKNCSTEKAG